MKKLIAILLALILIISVTACGNRSSVESDIPSSTEQSTEQSSSGEISENSPQSTDEQQENPSPAPQTPAPQSPTPQPTTHSHSYSSSVTAATCSSQGYTTYTCSCGHSYKDNYTSAAHSYSKYKCTKCGTVDKSNSIEYLKEWVKQHGFADGEEVIVRSYFEDCTYELIYFASSDSIHAVFYRRTDSLFSYASLILNKSNSHTVGHTIKYDNNNIVNVLATLNPASFTSNSPIIVTGYTGSPSEQASYANLTRLAAVILVRETKKYLSINIPELNIADLGYKSFDL